MSATQLSASLKAEELYSLFKSFHNYSLNYVYKGIFNPDLTDKILSLAENNMNLSGETSKTQKKVYFVMVESLQNITRHQDVNQQEENQAFFVVQNRNRDYELSSGNIIQSARVEDLKTKIDKINSLNADELKEYYKHVLENTGLSEKGGAGLGLIEMARRSGNKLSYDFEPVSNDLSYFYFGTRVTGETGSDAPTQKVLDEVKHLHTFTRNNNIHMIYQGLFTHENLKSLLSMTEGSIAKQENVAFKRKAVNVMIELLQNICNHAARPDPNEEGKPGMLLVCAGSAGCTLISGNFITNAQASALKSRIEKINGCNSDELDNLYSEIIMKETSPEEKGAGLGFIDMRMKSGGQVQHAITPIDNEFSFFNVNVFIPF